RRRPGCAVRRRTSPERRPGQPRPHRQHRSGGPESGPIGASARPERPGKAHRRPAGLDQLAGLRRHLPARAVSAGRSGRLPTGVITVPDNTLLRPAQLSVEAWVKPDPTITPGFHTILIKTTNTSWGDGYGLAQYSTPGVINFFVNNYSANSVAATIPLGQWS